MNSLLSKNIEVKGIDVREPLHQGHFEHWENADILKYPDLLRVFLEYAPTHVVHLAARTDLGLDDKLDNFRENIDGVENVINVCKTLQNLQSVIFASTILVCRAGYVSIEDDEYCPDTPYGESKMIGEKIVRESYGKTNFSCCIIRPTSIWGPGYGSHYLDFFRTIVSGRYFHPGKRNNRVIYGYIGNCTHQIEKLMIAPPEMTNQKMFYLGDYSPTQLWEWVEMIHLETGRDKIRVLPESLVKIIAKLGDMLLRLGWKSVPLTTFRLNNLCFYWN